MPTPTQVENLAGPIVGGWPTNDNSGVNSDCGPWEANAARYIAITEFDGVTFINHTAFVKTTDGLTYSAPLDAANAPVADGFICYKPDGAGTVIYFVAFGKIGVQDYQVTGMGSFDCATETYGPFVSWTVSPLPLGILFPLGFCRLSTGSFLFFYWTQNGDFVTGDQQLICVPVSAVGAVGSAILIADNPQPIGGTLMYLPSVAVDSRDMAHFTYLVTTVVGPGFTSNFEFAYNNILAGALGTPQSIFTGTRSFGKFFADTSSCLRGIFISTQNQVLLPAYMVINGAAGQVLNSGSWPANLSNVGIINATTAPTVQLDPIFDDAGSPYLGDSGFPSICINAAQSVVHVAMWQQNGGGDGSPPTTQVPVFCKQVNKPGWTQRVWWTYALDPPAVPANHIAGLTFAAFSFRLILSDTQFGVALTFSDPTFTVLGDGATFYMEAATNTPCIAPPPPPPGGSGLSGGRGRRTEGNIQAIRELQSMKAPKRPQICIEPPRVPPPPCDCCASATALLKAIGFWE